ncbi:OmpA family protein [Jiella avicenniae]|uniref:OmpA family protein n=1 Tax=Jiella avicenniae TaxID=2907202 RepID=A0A9X1T3R7_9HYPH|nr:OmpA family protein [Jiella avicenniae]MCE7026545.1 OmpA family protein [Jiella avicenniae]
MSGMTKAHRAETPAPRLSKVQDLSSRRVAAKAIRRHPAGHLAQFARTIGFAMILGGASAGHAQELKSIDLDTMLAEPAGPALGDCLAGKSEGCGGKAAEAARSFSRNELCDLKIVAGNECAKAAPANAELAAGERTRLLIVEEDPAAEAPLPSIDVEILFAYGSAEPLPASGTELQDLARLVTDQRFSKDRFVVIGHTDAAGSETYNQVLSTQRAASVRDRLVSLTGAGPERFVVAGRGESDLKDQADPLAAQNRRVQIVLLK